MSTDPDTQPDPIEWESLDPSTQHELVRLAETLGKDDPEESARKVTRRGAISGALGAAGAAALGGYATGSAQAQSQPAGTIGDGDEAADLQSVITKEITNNPVGAELIAGREEYTDDSTDTTPTLDQITETRTVAGSSYEVIMVPYRLEHQIRIDATGDNSNNNYLLPPYVGHRVSPTEGGVAALRFDGDNATPSNAKMGSLLTVGCRDTQLKVKGVNFVGQEPSSDEDVSVAAYHTRNLSIDQSSFAGTTAQNAVLSYNSHVDIEGDTDLGDTGQGATTKHGGTVGYLNGGASGSVGNVVATTPSSPAYLSGIDDVTTSSGVYRRDGPRAPAFNAETGHAYNAYGAEGAALYLGSDTSLASGSRDKVFLDTVEYDDRGEASTSSGRITVSDAGRYRIAGSVALDSITDGAQWTVAVAVNGVRIYRDTGYAGGGGFFRRSVSADVDLAADDDIELEALQGTGSSQTVVSGEDETYLTVNRIG